jgi:hypothetical protein
MKNIDYVNGETKKFENSAKAIEEKELGTYFTY